MKGRCHDALIGELINWWFNQSIDVMIFNPARASRLGSRKYIADLLFLERLEGFDYYSVMGVAEIENNEDEIMGKIQSLVSYENYAKQGAKVYPDLQFAILCHTLNIPNDELAQKIYDKILRISEKSDLLWIVCEIGRSLGNKETIDYSINMPNYIKGYDLFYYYRNFNSVILYPMKNGKQIRNIIVPGIEQ